MQPFEGRDGATGEDVRLRRPVRLSLRSGPNWLSQWLDDDTVVIAVNRQGNDELLECRLSTGACTLAERLPEVAVLPEIG